MTSSRNSNSNYTRQSCLDLYKLDSWAGGLTDGRNQESPSEVVNAYYSADRYVYMKLLNLQPLHQHLHHWKLLQLKCGGMRKKEEICMRKCLLKIIWLFDVLWSNKRDSGLWYGLAELKECRLGVQLLSFTSWWLGDWFRQVSDFLYKRICLSIPWKKIVYQC
jgi:hypothetical protein